MTAPDASLRHIPTDDLVPAHPSPGMQRRQAVDTAGMWSGTVETEPGMASGWHHHGAYETTIYVVSGVLRMEFGADGATAFDAGPGEFVYVPAGAVHREANPSEAPSLAVVVRAGTGEAVINVDGPA